MYRFAVGHNFLRLRESTMDFVYKNFPAVCQEEEFKELPKDILCQVLDSEQLCIDSEYQVRLNKYSNVAMMMKLVDIL